MKLVDTSSWIEYLRDRESEAGDAVEVLVPGEHCDRHFERLLPLAESL
jgi:hypothetical protein